MLMLLDRVLVTVNLMLVKRKKKKSVKGGKKRSFYHKIETNFRGSYYQ